MRMTAAGRNAVLFVVARGASLLVPLLSLPILGRALGPNGLGLLAYAQAFMQYFAVMVDFGFNYVSISTVARRRDDPLELRRVFWSICASRLVLYLACLPLIGLGAWLLADHVEESKVLGLATLLLTGVLLTPGWLYQGLEQGVPFVVMSVLPRLCSLPLIWLYIETPDHVLRAAAILWGAELVGGVTLFTYAWWRLVPGRIVADLRVAREECRRALDAWIGALAITVVANINPLVLRELVNLSAVGLYSVADRIVRVMYSLLYPVVQAFQPEVTRLWSRDPAGARRLALRVTCALMSAAGLFFLGVQVLAAPIVTLLFGGQFLAAAEVLHIHAAFTVFSAASTAALYFLYYARDDGRATRPWFAALLPLHFLLLWILVPRYAADGAALATVLGEAAVAGGLWFYALRRTRPAPKVAGGCKSRPAPSVSIVVCNRNHARYLSQAIESALAQTLPCEVIVVDDGSTDASRELLKEWAQRVQVLLLPAGGDSAAYSSGFAACHGDIVIFLDSDHFLEPEAAETMAAAFGDDVAKVHCRVRLVDADGQPLRGTAPNPMVDGDVLPALAADGGLYASAPGSGNAYRRRELERLFPLRADRDGADFVAAGGPVASGQVRSVKRTLANYRVHDRRA